MVAGDPPIASMDALIAAAGIDVTVGFQVVGFQVVGGQGVGVQGVAGGGAGTGGADQPDARVPVIVLRTGEPADLGGRLAKYPDETAVTLLVAGPGGAVLGEAGGTVATLGGRLRARWPAGRAEVVGLALPALAAEDVRDDMQGLVGVIRRLRDPEDGCPWDLAQDHQSLRPHLLEEAYEVLEALDGLSGGQPSAEAVDALREELGDLLMQVVLHARVAEQAGEFTLGEVAEGIRGKLVRRHPHVFGAVEASTPEEVARNWDRIKAAESKEDGSVRESAVDGVPTILPALARAQRLTGRASRAGFAWESDADVLLKLAEELQEIAQAPESERGGEVGDLLFVVCDFLRRQGVEAEDALREACGKFGRRFRALEEMLREEGASMESVGQAGLLERWERVKGREAKG